MTYISTKTETRSLISRFLNYPEDIDPKLRAAMYSIAVGLRRGSVSQTTAAQLGTLVQGLGGEYLMPDRYNVVYLPPSTALERFFFSRPKILVQAGLRGSGKTITAWTLALRWLRKHPAGQVHVIGDIDELADPIAERGIPVVVHENIHIPRDRKPKIIIYNELVEDVLSTSAMKKGARRASLGVFRARHYNSWIIFNAVRLKSLLSVARETADAILIRYSPPHLLLSLRDVLPPLVGDAVMVASRLDVNRAVAIWSVPGKGTYISIYPTDPPSWLLDLPREIKRRAVRSREDRDAYILSLSKEGLNAKEIAERLEAEGWGKLTVRRVRQIISAAKRGEKAE